MGIKNGVKSNLMRITYYALEKDVDACFFGHTHEAIINNYHDLFLMNPGSLAEPRGHDKASYGIVTISDIITGEVITI